MRLIALTIVPILLAAGCDSDSPTAASGDPYELQSVVQVSQSNYTEPQYLTIRSAADWAEAWTRLHGALEPKPVRPAIDFGRELVVVAAAGTRPNGCYSIEIRGVQPSIEGQPVFDVLETTPGAGCVCTEALTRPAHAVRVNRFTGEAEFLERAREVDC